MGMVPLVVFGLMITNEYRRARVGGHFRVANMLVFGLTSMWALTSAIECAYETMAIRPFTYNAATISDILLMFGLNAVLIYYWLALTRRI